jgi:hypothetical protein
MILARITQALRDQNWLAVAIEFVIVILGVVIGFQISAWNDQRQAVARAEVLTERLIQDMRNEQWRIAAIRAYNAEVSDHAQTVVDALEGRHEIDDEALVIAAFRATQMINFTIIRATYDELVATGGINLINDRALIDVAVEYYDTTLEQMTLMAPDRPYRQAFFQLADRPLYDFLANNCAETPNGLSLGDYASLDNLLDRPCEIDGHDAAIEAIADHLRNTPSILPLIRHRAIETSVEVRGQTYWRNLLDSAVPDEGDAS